MKKKLSGPPAGEAWVWQTITLKCSPAWLHRTHRAMLVTEFLEVEHMRHGGFENGNLLAPHRQLAHIGMRRETIADAIDENIARKLVVRTGGGVDPETGKRLPFRYRLTYLPTIDGPPTNEWKRYKAAAPAKSPEKVEKAKRAAARWAEAAAQKKQKPGTGFGTKAVPLSVPGENQKPPVSTKNRVPVSVPGGGTDFGTTIYIWGVSTPSAEHCTACDGCSTGRDCPTGNVVWGEFGRLVKSAALPKGPQMSGGVPRGTRSPAPGREACPGGGDHGTCSRLAR
jgi:hypothetical protein